MEQYCANEILQIFVFNICLNLHLTLTFLKLASTRGCQPYFIVWKIWHQWGKNTFAKYMGATIEIWFFIPFEAFSSIEMTSIVSDGNRLSCVTGPRAKKIIWGLFFKILRFCMNEKTKIYNQMEACFKVFLTMQITLTKFEEKRRCSCDKKFLQLPLVTVKLSKFVFLSDICLGEYLSFTYTWIREWIKRFCWDIFFNHFLLLM